VPTAWFDLALGLVRTTQGFSPPVVSRAFGYAGVALYEAVAPGITKRGSFVGVLNGLTRAPGAADSAYRPRAFTVIQRLVGSLAHELPGHPQVRSRPLVAVDSSSPAPPSGHPCCATVPRRSSPEPETRSGSRIGDFVTQPAHRDRQPDGRRAAAL
jgi:hypothetical protein